MSSTSDTEALKEKYKEQLRDNVGVPVFTVYSPPKVTPTFGETLQLYKIVREKQKARDRANLKQWYEEQKATFKRTFYGLFHQPEEELEAGPYYPKFIDFEGEPEYGLFETHRRVNNYCDRFMKYPTFNIEPFPHERQRVNTLMTPEDRMRRKAWVKAQNLDPSEPRGDYFRPFNPVRRMYRTPMDRLETLIRVRHGADHARLLRSTMSLVIMGTATMMGLFYWVNYNKKTWEYPGPHIDKSHPVVIGAPAPVKEHYGDLEFHDRKVLLDMKTSFNSEKVPADD